MNSVTRQSYTMAHDAFVAWARIRRLRLDEDHASLNRVLVRYMDEELFAEGESAAITTMTLFGTVYCRRIPRQPQIMSRGVCLGRPWVLEGPTAAGSDGDVSKLPPEAASLVGQTCWPGACHVMRPLHEDRSLPKRGAAVQCPPSSHRLGLQAT